jgi:hypothetical protein
MKIVLVFSGARTAFSCLKRYKFKTVSSIQSFCYDMISIQREKVEVNIARTGSWSHQSKKTAIIFIMIQMYLNKFYCYRYLNLFTIFTDIATINQLLKYLVLLSFCSLLSALLHHWYAKLISNKTFYALPSVCLMNIKISDNMQSHLTWQVNILLKMLLKISRRCHIMAKMVDWHHGSSFFVLAHTSQKVNVLI